MKQLLTEQKKKTKVEVLSQWCFCVSVSGERLQRAALCRRAGHRQHEAQSEGLFSGWGLQTHHHQAHWCQLVSSQWNTCIFSLKQRGTLLLLFCFNGTAVTFSLPASSHRPSSSSVCVVCREIIQYDDPRIPLVHSDFEKLENKPAPVFNKGEFHLGLFCQKKMKQWHSNCLSCVGSFSL